MKKDPGCSSPPHLVRFTIDASRCNLRVGDRVTPSTQIGLDGSTGELVKSGCCGEVVAVNFSGARHTLEVILRTASPVEESSPGYRGAV